MDMKKILIFGTISMNQFLLFNVTASMKLSMRNIAIALGIAAGAAIAAVVTTKSNKNNNLFTKKKKDVQNGLVADERPDVENIDEDEALYI